MHKYLKKKNGKIHAHTISYHLYSVEKKSQKLLKQYKEHAQNLSLLAQLSKKRKSLLN